MGGVEYQVTKVDPTDPETKGMVYQVHKVSEEIAATLGGKVYRARIINDPTAPTVAGKVYQIVLIGDPSDPAVKGKVYNAILTGGSEAVVVGPAVSPLALPDAIADSLVYVKAFGGTGQNGTPTPDAPVDIVSNNGALKVGYTSRNLNVGTLDNQGYTSTGGTSTSTTFCGTLWKIKVNPGEKYTVSFGNFPDGVSGVFINTWKTDGTWNLRQAISISGAYTYTIPEDIGWVNFTLYKTGGITIGSNSWMQVEKGETATDYVPAGYGLYVDGTTETINVHGKNLFDIDSCIANTYINSEGATNASASWKCSGFIPVSPNTGYVFTVDTTSGASAKHCFYAQAQTESFISYIDSGSQTFTTPPNARYMRISVRKESAQAQLELGTTATTYAPYYNGGTATAEMLLKVGDYQDEQEILSGAVTRNVGVMMLDGTENVGTSNATFTVAISDRVTSKTPLVCSHFEYSTKTSSQVENLKVISFSSTNIGFRYDACADTTAFKTWLADQYAAGTPVIVVYQLATETTESVAGQTLQVTDGDNTLEITQASLDGLELEAQYNAAVSLTIQEVEDANLDNNVTVTIQ